MQTCMVPFYYNLSHFCFHRIDLAYHSSGQTPKNHLGCPGVLCSCRRGGATYGPRPGAGKAPHRWIVVVNFPSLFPSNGKLGGGNSNIFYFHPENWGRWSHFDEHIFQMGWNSTTNQKRFWKPQTCSIEKGWSSSDDVQKPGKKATNPQVK